MAAGGFLLGLSQGMQQAQARSFERQRWEAQQQERADRMAQIEQNNALRRQEMQMMAKQREQSAFLQGLKAYSGIKDPTIKSQMYNKLLMPYINKDLQENDANYGGQPVFLPSGTTKTDFETPNNPIDKALKDINSVYNNKNFDRADRLAQVVPIINRIGSDPTYFPRVQRDLQERKAYLQESKNWFLQNQVGMMNKDPNVTREWAQRTAQIKKMGPDGQEVLGTIAENMAKANETMRVEEVERQNMRQKEVLARQKEDRIQARMDARAKMRATAEIKKGESAVTAAKVRSNADSARDIRKHYRTKFSDYNKDVLKPAKKMDRDVKELFKLLGRHGNKIIGATGAGQRFMSSALAQVSAATGWQVPQGLVKNASAANRARALMVNIAFAKAKIQDPGKLTDKDYMLGQVSALSNSQNVQDLIAVANQTRNDTLLAARDEYQTMVESEGVELGQFGERPIRRPLLLPEPSEAPIMQNPQQQVPALNPGPPELMPAVATAPVQTMPTQEPPAATDVNQGVQPIGAQTIAPPVMQPPAPTPPQAPPVAPTAPTPTPTMPPEQPVTPAQTLPGAQVAQQITQKYQLPQPITEYLRMSREQLIALPRELKRRVINAHKEMIQHYKGRQ